MTRRQRVAVVVVFIACAAGAVAGLSALSSASEGPLSSALGWLGAMTGSIEHRVRDRVEGPGRRAKLAWAAPYRDDAARLRRPDVMLLGAYDGAAPMRSAGQTVPARNRSELISVVSKDGTRIGVECAGTGPTLLFVHGGVGDRARHRPGLIER